MIKIQEAIAAYLEVGETLEGEEDQVVAILVLAGAVAAAADALEATAIFQDEVIDRSLGEKEKLMRSMGLG